jgi:ubiquitin carboxyl-terminal hydrolase 14
MSGDSIVKVNVKWGKQVLKDVEIDLNEPPAVFKMQLWTLTGVSPDKQTILGLRGGKLKDDSEWATAKPKPGMSIMLMGTPDEASLAPPPASLPKVRDDLDAAINDSMNYEPPPMNPPGLVNLGNTCYMNATVQCLNAVPELRQALTQYKGSTAAGNPAEKLTAGLRDLVSRLGGKGTVSSVNPQSFLFILRQVSPQFAERNPQGMFMQQDAEECWGEVLSRLATSLKIPRTTGADAGALENAIDSAFALTIKSTDSCEDKDSDESVTRSEQVRTLKCHISSTVNHLSQGISEGLEEQIEKHSDALDRSALWKRSSRIDHLPPYLIVQFVRFFWKPQERVKAKILRNVSFPGNLDVYDFCTDELKAKLDLKRHAAVASEDTGVSTTTPLASVETGTVEPLTSEPVSNAAGSTNTSSVPSGSPIPAEIDTVDASSSAESPGLKAESGNYELCAVLTHQGRAADAGHYVAWVKDIGTTWYKYDDDKVSVHTEEDVKKLSGGGDWHMAYMCLYRATN